MHIDRSGVQHPITLEIAQESDDQFYAVCGACSARWSGPFERHELAEDLVRMANEHSDVMFTKRLRSTVCCPQPSTTDQGPSWADLRAAESRARQIPPQVAIPLDRDTPGRDALRVVIGMITIVVTAVVGLARAITALVRSVVSLGRFAVPLAMGFLIALWGLGRLRLASHVAEHTGMILLGGAWVFGGIIVVVLIRRLRRASRKDQETTLESDCSTPLTTAPHGGSVGVVGKEDPQPTKRSDWRDSWLRK